MKQLFFILISIVLLAACQRENLIEEVVGPVDGAEVQVFGSVDGYITDENENFVEGALVSIGAYQTETNEFGLFEFSDILISRDEAYVQVEKSGYFSGSRTFSTRINEQPIIKIQLIAKSYIEILHTDQGGSVEFDNTIVDFPSGEYRLDDGSPYQGEILVYGLYLDPTENDSYLKMPGGMNGLNLDGELRSLESYGIVGIELETPAGEYLQLPLDKEAEISIKVPSNILGTAPNSIALSHFDPSNGLWIEEGIASLVGDRYRASVSHFSFWNCNELFDFVDVSGNVEISGIGYEGLLVRITNLETNNFRIETTGVDGFFLASVPKGQELVFEVIGLCDSTIAEENIGSLNSDQDLGVFEAVPVGSNTEETVFLSGFMFSCTGDIVEQGFVVAEVGELEYVSPIEDDGSFVLGIPTCGLESEIAIIGFDELNGNFSFPELIPAEDNSELILVVCPDIFQTEYEIFYEGQNWNSVGSDSTSMTLVEIDFSDEGALQLVISIIDYEVYEDTGLVQCIAIFSMSENPDEAEYELMFESQGFKISGVCSKETEEEDLFEQCIFHDVSTNIEILDPGLYPGDVGEVDFTIRI